MSPVVEAIDSNRRKTGIGDASANGSKQRASLRNTKEMDLAILSSMSFVTGDLPLTWTPSSNAVAAVSNVNGESNIKKCAAGPIECMYGIYSSYSPPSSHERMTPELRRGCRRQCREDPYIKVSFHDF